MTANEPPANYAGQPVPQPSHPLTRAQQSELLMWHPVFTGKSPHCGQVFPQNELPKEWKCEVCGWQEASK